MPWPLSQDYNEAVQSPALCFQDPELRQTEAATTAIGLPRPYSGNFADVYEMGLPGRNHKWAVKCFTREVPGLRDRYTAISAYLRQVDLPFMVDFTYLDPGIRVRGLWYPILKMHWVEGLTLNAFVKQYADQPATLDVICQVWLRLARRLRDANLGHCDLQHGNILLVPDPQTAALNLKLIDYDGMFVPALVRKKSGEVGHPAYQHPQRLREGTYTVEVDRFPHLVIYTALRSLIVGGRALWNKYDNGDNLLFRQQDLQAPHQSPLFRELLTFQDAEVRHLAGHLSQSVGRPLEQTPLLDELMGGGHATATGTGRGTPRTTTAPLIQSRTTALRRKGAGRKRSPLARATGLACLVLLGGAVLLYFLYRDKGFPPSAQATSRKIPVTERVAPPLDRRFPVPDAAAQARAEKSIRETFQPDYAKSASGDRARLAAKLLQRAQETRTDRDTHFVLLRESRDLAARAGYWDGVFMAIDGLAQVYAVDADDMKIAILQDTSRAAGSPAFDWDLFDACIALVDQAIAGDRYDPARKAVLVAEGIVVREPWIPSSDRIAARRQLVTELQKEYDVVKSCADTLRKDPFDVQANQMLGRFFCLLKGDWDRGLPMLSRGSDPTLKSLAIQDLQAQQKSAGAAVQIRAGDGWWDLARKEGGLGLQRAQGRAGFWYRQAVPQLAGPSRTQVETRLRELDPPQPAPRRLSVPNTLNGFVQRTEINCAKQAHSYSVGNSFGIAASWVLATEFFVPDLLRESRQIVFWGDDRPGRDPMYLRIDGPELEAAVGNAEADAVHKVVAPIPEYAVKRWLSVVWRYQAHVPAVELYLDGRLIRSGNCPVKPVVDRPMPLWLGGVNARDQRFRNRIRLAWLSN